MPFPRSLILACLVAAASGCRLPVVGALDAPDPAPHLGAAAGVPVSIEFHVEGEPDDVGEAPSHLALADALREALLHDPRVQQALARWHVARAGSEEARLLPNPVLSVGLLIARSVRDATVTVGLTREIGAYFQRPHRVAAFDARLRAAAEDALEVALDVVQETRAAYLEAQAAEMRRGSVTERLELVERLLQRQRVAVEQGEGSPIETTALDAERAAVALDGLEAEADGVRARIEMARLVGRVSDPGTWTLDPWPALPAPIDDESAWLQASLERRPEVRALRWELAALGEERALIGLWPWDGVVGGLEAEYDDGLSVGPAVELPLRLTDTAAPRRAALDATTAALCHRVVELRRAVLRDVRLALADEKAARRALALLDGDLIPLLERRRELIEVARRAGEIEFTLVLLADRELQEARTRRIEKERRVHEARLRLERAAGGPGGVPSLSDEPQPALKGGDSR